MRRKYSLRRRRSKGRAKIILVMSIGGLFVAATGLWWYGHSFSFDQASESYRGSQVVLPPPKAANFDAPATPLTGRSFYLDNNRAVSRQAADYRKQGKSAEAALLNRIASQPGTTWLTGPSPGDPAANRDIETVRRTSAEAAVLDAVPVYQLYAIPARDACAAHSRGGFANSTDYLNWIDRIIEALSSDAVIAVEADAIAHAVGSSCMSEQQQNDRYALLKQAIMRLSHASRVTAIYLDAGHPEWLPNPADLVRPLQQSGVEYTRGIAVNVSFFTETNTAAAWSQKLLQLLGGEKAAIIDTSRNGRGVYGGQGDARWCNPPGRGVGLAPTTQTGLAGIDAYFWGKNIGESDGDCGGYPAAGVFVPKIALELARNARQ